MESDITFVTSFRSFEVALDAVAQCSAAFSWSLERLSVVAVGDGPGVFDFCRDKGFALLGRVRSAADCGLKTSHPMLRDMLRAALDYAKTGFLCLLNADIIIPPGFHSRLGSILLGARNPMVTGMRHNVILDREICTIEEYLRAWQELPRVSLEGGGSDWFAFHRRLCQSMLSRMPDYVFGATAWDNWLQWAGLTMADPPINATAVLPTLHPQHTQKSLLVGGEPNIDVAPAVLYNRRLYYSSPQQASMYDRRWRIL